MEIRYLKKLQQAPVIEGISEERINKLEKEISRKFPQAYREFLFLIGKYSRFNANGDYWRFNKLVDIQNKVEEQLSEENFKMEKDFWVFVFFNNGDYSLYFHWDEGEDPAVYGITNFNDDNITIEKVSNSFSKYVNDILYLKSRILEKIDSL